jgi:hypothetical protein
MRPGQLNNRGDSIMFLGLLPHPGLMLSPGLIPSLPNIGAVSFDAERKPPKIDKQK